MPAATAACTPGTLSSITTQDAGADLHRRSGEQEQVGRRLAARHLGCAEYVRFEIPQQAGQRQRMTQPSGALLEATQRRCGNACSAAATPAIGSSSVSNAAATAPPHRFAEVLRQATPVARLDVGAHLRVR